MNQSDCKMPSDISKEYLYRVDREKDVISIAQHGLWCGAYTRVPEHLRKPGQVHEHEKARKYGVCFPTGALEYSPRIYLYLFEKYARAYAENTSHFSSDSYYLLRLSRQAPALRDDTLYYIDAAYVDLENAVYVLCPDATDGDPVIEPRFIEIEVDGNWLPLTGYVDTLVMRQQSRATYMQVPSLEQVEVTDRPKRSTWMMWLRRFVGLK